MFKKKISEIANALELEKIPYMIIGGQAVLMYGEPRFTKDIDITLGVDIDKISSVFRVIEKIGFQVAVKNPEIFVKKYSVLPANDPETSVRVDFIFSFMPYEKEAINRAKRFIIDGVEVVYASIEDLIIHKIMASRPRDLEDVKSILRLNPDVNKEIIQKWLVKFKEVNGIDLWNLFQSLSS